QAVSATEHGTAGAPAEPELGAADIFMGLFKHLEPHAVTALWLGGNQGLSLVKPYAANADGQPLALDAHGHPVNFHDRTELQAHYAEAFGGGVGVLVYNINTVQWIAGGLLLVAALAAARSARRQAGQAPRGRAFHLIESIVLFVRDDMVYAVMGKEHGRHFTKLFLTQFFFILFMNLFGLIPLAMLGLGSLGATATANLAVTAALALTTLVAIHVAGMRQHGFVHHWQNFIPHGLPWFVLPIMIPVEIVGMLVKPAALTIRLFANMTAGHLVMLGFFGLVYLFGGMGLPALAMAIAIACLELFVCFVQAYIFTYLSIVFVGASVHPEH
ncbi:MAG: F0F1 ATP synthase subunit A, partial [Planctomycetes bacterium]|nr:F0F1 ATP synthase subunit A [Planctomycetota bacterium]